MATKRTVYCIDIDPREAGSVAGYERAMRQVSETLRRNGYSGLLTTFGESWLTRQEREIDGETVGLLREIRGVTVRKFPTSSAD